MSFFSSIRLIFTSPASLRQKATAAGVWTVVELATGHFLRLASNLILSRLVLPEAFGVMAMVATLLTALELFTDIGIRQSVLRSHRGEEPYFLRAAWTIQLLRRSLAVATLVVFSGVLLWQLGPLLAPRNTVYANPELPFLIMASAIVVILQGLTSTNVLLASRNMRYARTSAINIASQTVSIFTSIGIALIYHSPWALLFGMIIGATTNTALSHFVLTGPRMKFVFDRTIAREFWHFGKWIIASSTFTFFGSNATTLMLAAFLDETLFAHYIIATIWVGGATQILDRISDNIVFPIFSNYSGQNIGDTLNSVSNMFDILSFFIFLLAIFLVPMLIVYLYPAEYVSTSIMVPLLSVAVLQTHFLLFNKLLLVRGESRAVMIYSATQTALLCVILPFGFYTYGLAGALAATIAAPALASVTYLFRAAQIPGIAMGRHVAWLAAIFTLATVLLATMPRLN